MWSSFLFNCTGRTVQINRVKIQSLLGHDYALTGKSLPTLRDFDNFNRVSECII
jgi:hypothetical protein